MTDSSPELGRDDLMPGHGQADDVLTEERILAGEEQPNAESAGVDGFEGDEVETREDGAPVWRRRDSSDGIAELGVVLVCYNGWRDTIECLESLLRSDLPIRVAVVDNGSSDGSAERIRAWASGEEPFTPPDNELARLTTPPIAKPVEMLVLSGTSAPATNPGKARVTLIESVDNLGFAGGNNVGMRHLFRDPHIGFTWLLNNDTVVEPTASRALLDTLKTDPWNGMVGTVIRYYNAPEKLQALNGMDFNLFTGNSKGIHGNKPAAGSYDPKKVARSTEFVLGASLAVSRRFFETIGPMSEAYFLYFEEVDWARRNAGRFAIAFARGATVYHKHGGSIGSSSVKGGRSPTSEYWLLRSKLLFYRRYHPVLLPLIWAQGCVQTAKRVVRRQPDSVKAMLKALTFRSL